VRKQCELLDFNRSNLYYLAHPKNYHSVEFREAVMARIDWHHTNEPAWGVNKIVPLLKNEGLSVSRELVSELMREMRIITIYPHFNTSKAEKNARKMPYLLKNKLIWLPNQVWAIDITYIKMGGSHMYLTAIIDWFSRYIVGWTLSDSLDTAPVIKALENAFKQYGVPSIVNSDQGSQFTSDDYVQLLVKYHVTQSMDGKGKWADNIAIERWFRSLKTERIYIFDYQNPRELRDGISEYVGRYNNLRPHQSHNFKTPQIVYTTPFSGCCDVLRKVA